MKTLIKLLDFSGSVLSLISTIYYARRDIKAWLYGIGATGIDVILYGLTGIYGDMSLTLIYFFSMFYGLHQWSSHKNNDNYSIKTLSLRAIGSLGALSIILTLVVAQLLKYVLHSTVPYMDSTTTVFSLIAQILICKKYIENWALWFFVDSIYIILYYHKGIPLHAFLKVIYLGLAIYGFTNWFKLYKKQYELISIV